MAKKNKDKAKKDKDDKEQQAQTADPIAHLEIDDGPDVAVRVGTLPPQLDPDRHGPEGIQDTTDPRGKPGPKGADKPDQSLQDMVGKVGDKAVPTGPNKHGIGSPVPGEEKVDGKKGADWLKEHDEKSLLKEFDMNPDAGRPSSGFPGASKDNKVTKSGGEDTTSSTKVGFGGGQSEGGGGIMGDLDKLPAGVELNSNAPDWKLAAAEPAKGSAKASDLQGLLPNQFGNKDQKEFKAADKDSFVEKQAKQSGDTSAEHKAWLEKTNPAKKYTDPDHIEAKVVKPENPQDVDPGTGISHTVNPLDENPATVDTSQFDPKADPNAPLILTDGDTVDTPVTADGSQPVPDPGTGISKIVNPLTDPMPPPPPGGTHTNNPPSNPPGGGETPATIGAPSTPQAAVQSGEDFAAPDAGAPGAVPEPGALQDLDGDGQPG